MTEHIQPEPSPRPRLEPVDTAESSEPLVRELRRRLSALEQEKRRWKLIGVSSLVALALLVVGGGVVGVGTATYYSFRMKQAQVEAVMRAEQAQMEAMRAQEAMEQARRQADAAKRTLEKALKDGD
jgi:uncharacterized protein HemX